MNQSGLTSRLLERLPLNQRKRVRRWMRRVSRPAWLGTLRRTAPLSDHYGYDRGRPVDRYYIEKFLDYSRSAIRGRVLEVKDSTYTDRFGSQVEQRDVLDMDAANPKATVVADLSAADGVPDNQFDCFVLTQTLQLIYDVQAAVRHCHRILRPGGTLLVTVPSVSRVVPGLGLESDFWRFTQPACARLFGDAFGPQQVTVLAYGNVLSSIAFLAGMACEELSQRELDETDEYFPVIIAVRAVKA